MSKQVRELQRNLYRAAKVNRKRVFYSLHDKIYRMDVLQEAWLRVKRNSGAPGVDGVTIDDIESMGVDKFLLEIHRELHGGIYRSKRTRKVEIPKPNGGLRQLGIPTVKDRLVQTATRIVIEPIFEANFQDCSFGFRPKRSAT